MDATAIAQVRRFNRVVTQRVGALDDRFLARGRPLGEARLLWEVGHGGSDVRALRTQLGLDSGYLSRLLRSLEAARLVRVSPGAEDRRVRRVTLTAAGRREVAQLDRRSDDLAASLLDRLGPAQRERLVGAMREVERLIAATAVEIAPCPPEDPAARHCLAEYAAESSRRFVGGFDLGRSRMPEPGDLGPPHGLLLVATLHDEPVGCGGLRFHDGEPTELKRLWVDPSVRGLGVGRRLMDELEARAAERHPVVRLDTNAALTEAIAMYRARGYQEVEPFNDEVHAHHWFQKRLAA